MYNRKPKNQKPPMFAEVSLNDTDVDQVACDNSRRQRTPFIKLTYPNGVNLILPMDITAEKLQEFIRIRP